MHCSCFHLYEYAYVTTVNYVLSQIQLTSKSLSENRGMKGISCVGSRSAGNQLGRPERSKAGKKSKVISHYNNVCESLARITGSVIVQIMTGFELDKRPREKPNS